jgi:anti-anti-sigma factor
MDRPCNHIDIQLDGDVFCVSLRQQDLDDPTIRAMSDEVETLIRNHGCRKLVLRLGPVHCLYSVLIARLIKLRRSMAEHGGRMKICDVQPDVMSVFESCQLQNYFDFAPDLATAVSALKRP